MTKENQKALKILHAWALRVKEQSEIERRIDIAVSEEPKIYDIGELPDGSDLVSEY